MSNYKRGANFEYRVRDLFREKGFQAERKAASSPYDLLVLDGGEVVFVVDAKKTSISDREHLYVSKDDIEKIIESGEKLGAQPLITYGFQRTDIFVAFPGELLGGDNKHVRLEEGISLDSFLDNW